ncbi:DUF6049 family protein [Rhodococcus sp. NPDC058521]|uniref:DUF6049 family protein n=1 Tax=Rhodococcus sp. NPDC058521 TaxID=3346536 RepID=UPI0036620DC2
MKPVLRRAGAVIMTAVAVSFGPTAATLASATPAPTQDPAPIRGDSETEEPQFLHLDIDEVTPSSVTTSSEPVVTVKGSIRNVGDRPVEDVDIRLQRGPEITESPALRSSLTVDQSRYDTVGEFDTVANRLTQGASKDFTLSLPLRSDTEASLDITEPGVYPLMVNVNGTPAYGGAARLDDARFLLPVLGVPGTPAVPPDTASPVGMTMMWPLADRPRLAAGIPGSVNDPVRLVDDDLAKSLDEGGRLDELVSALESATRDSADRNHELRDSLCLGVDPDLLITVENMTRGYLVLDNPRQPNGATHEGAGRDAATAWLDRVQALAQNMCTTALPFAQVDLAALTAIGNPRLTESALSSPADLVDSILGVTTMRSLVWSDSGVMDTATAATLRREKDTTTLVASNAVDVDPITGERARLLDPLSAAEGQSAAGAVDALLFDPSVAASLAAVGTNPQTPSFTPPGSRYKLVDDSETARRQDALGAMSWSALNPPERGEPAPPRTAVLVPPQLWSADGDDAEALLAGLSSLYRSGLATPRPLDKAVGGTPDLPGITELDYPHRAREDGTTEEVRLAAADQLPRIESLQAALVPDPQGLLTPARFTAPLREDLLRAMSLAHRRDAERARAEEAAVRRTEQVATSLDHMREAVSVVSPGGVYTLASEQSPLLLVARNDLPIGIDVRLHVDAPSGVEITDIGPTTLPPRGSRTLTVPAQIDDSRKLDVKFSLTTADGRALGEPTTATVRSNAYGQALAILTGCAGALLLLLAGRRLWHRFRGQPDPADEGYERS